MPILGSLGGSSVRAFTQLDYIPVLTPSKCFAYLLGGIPIHNASIPWGAPDPNGTVFDVFLQLRDQKGVNILTNSGVSSASFSYSNYISPVTSVSYVGDGVYKRTLKVAGLASDPGIPGVSTVVFWRINSVTAPSNQTLYIRSN